MELDVQGWVLGALTSTALTTVLAYLFRESVAKFFTKTIEHRFEKRLEKFKSGIRDNEAELSQIRSFLVSARRDRDIAIQSKRFEAAETLMRARYRLSQFGMLVEYIKILNTEQLLKDSNDPKIAEFIGMILKPFDVDEKYRILGELDMTAPKLYLSDKTLKIFEAYQLIIFTATMTLKLLAVPIGGKGELLKAGSLSKAVTELVPHSKDGFEKFGESYAYHWATYFHDDLLRSLRHELSGADDNTRNAAAIQQVAMDSRRAQMDIRSSLDKAGLSQDLIMADKVEEIDASVTTDAKS